ncbi:helix-turn-helix transcriptional regulator [Hymenobacter arizonensis]|uniref:AraC-type DNA-binding protein n=1 Tax=Hymenobacter arizonensis TaxID=1227077 RepID=A0A1I6AIY2_HYMAR|nr:AraC family transcriptional regulator [Hymenobacter arizonensis]SFQ68646.1 AraC-type DNA-binding protein [Hymenobacter arizonensis]
MVFEFVPYPGFDFLKSFGEEFNLPVAGDTLHIPPTLGEGRIRKVDMGPDFRLFVHRYRLKQDLVLKRRAAPLPNHELVSFIFNLNEEPLTLEAEGQEFAFARNTAFAVEISSTDLDTTIHFPAHTDIYFTVVGVLLPALRTLLGVAQPNNVVATILSGAAGFHYHERMGVDEQRILKEMSDVGPVDPLSSLFYRIRVQQLIYCLFEKLLQRDAPPHSPLHKADAEKLALVQAAVLSDLGTPPQLPPLARMAGMSESKLSALFKQVYGDSIYNYYQRARMEEAAFLLRHSGYSVSETGFRLGFTNLSHFTRLFEKHLGAKPKRYSAGG